MFPLRLLPFPILIGGLPLLIFLPLPPLSLIPLTFRFLFLRSTKFPSLVRMARAKRASLAPSTSCDDRGPRVEKSLFSSLSFFRASTRFGKRWVTCVFFQPFSHSIPWKSEGKKGKIGTEKRDQDVVATSTRSITPRGREEKAPPTNSNTACKREEEN